MMQNKKEKRQLNKKAWVKYGLISLGVIGVSAISIGSVISCSTNSTNNTNNSGHIQYTNNEITFKNVSANSTLVDTNTSNLVINATFKANFNVNNNDIAWLINDIPINTVVYNFVPSTNNVAYYHTSCTNNTATITINNDGINSIAKYFNLSNDGSFNIQVLQAGQGATMSAPLTIKYFTYNLTNVPKNTNSDIKTIKQANTDWTNKWNSYSSTLQNTLLTSNFNEKFSQVLSAHNEDFSSPKAFSSDSNSAIAGWTYTKNVSVNNEYTNIELVPSSIKNEYDIQIEINIVYSTSQWKDFAAVTEKLDITNAIFTPSVINGSNYGESGYFGAVVLSSYTSATLNVSTVYNTVPSTVTSSEVNAIKDAMNYIAPNYNNYVIKQGSALSAELSQNADVIIGNLNGMNYGDLSN